MQITIRPSLHQIRTQIQAALGAFETLEGGVAIRHCQWTLQALLRYLDILDRAKDLPILRMIEVDGKIRLEGPICDFKITDTANVEISETVSGPEAFKKDNLILGGE